MDFSAVIKEETVNEHDDDVDGESDRFHEAFVCCICRDLLYKPVVLACGHISCFWCVHKSMSGLYKSRCPICRNQYFHFPFICQTLHLLLFKMYPGAYKRRENQTLEEENDIGCFSPQINVPLVHELQAEDTIIKHASQPCFHPETGLDNLLDPRKVITSTGVTTASDRNSNQIHSNVTCKEVSVDDVLCVSCNRMLFHPIVLNCGHAFCTCCIVPQTNEMIKCEVCQNLHPGGIPKVCLDFDHFVEEKFPKEYELRRATLQMKQEQLSSETQSSSTCSSEAGKETFHFSFSSGDDPLQWWNANSKVHIGVGCDSCGMFPIVGNRYRCKDCVEQIGYDLCNDCYTSSSKLPGRFNQQHTSDHTFEIVKSSSMRNKMLRLLRAQLQEASTVSSALDDSPENVILSPENTSEDGENVVDATLSSSESGPNQRGNDRSA